MDVARVLLIWWENCQKVGCLCLGKEKSESCLKVGVGENGIIVCA